MFLDLKFHDIPNTVAGAVRPRQRLGVWMVNVHASGGRAMMRGRAREAGERRRRARRPRAARDRRHRAHQPGRRRRSPRSACAASPLDQVVRLARLAQAAGLDGVVASPQEVGRDSRGLRSRTSSIVTPGIRGGSGGDSRRRSAADGDAGRRRSRAGSSYLVVGRPITAAADPRAAAAADIAKQNVRLGAEVGRLERIDVRVRSPHLIERELPSSDALLSRNHEVAAAVLRPAALRSLRGRTAVPCPC